MFIIVELVILALITVLVTVVGPFAAANIGDPPKPAGLLLGVIPAILFTVVWVLASLYQVHAKELGVLTSFGRPVGHSGPGLHMSWPWQEVTKINETVFTDTYDGDHMIPVRLGDGNTASVSATIRWHVNPEAADYIYSNYRSDNPAESLRDAVVDTQFSAALNQVSSGFNPTANVKSALAGGVLNFSPDYAAMSKAVTETMLTRVKDADGQSLVIIDGITVAGIKYSQATEDRINSIVAQVAKTQQAVQAEQTAKAQSSANDILAASLDRNPYVLVSRCLDLIADKSFVPPAGFSCWPGSGTAVVIPQAVK